MYRSDGLLQSTCHKVGSTPTSCCRSHKDNTIISLITYLLTSIDSKSRKKITIIFLIGPNVIEVILFTKKLQTYIEFLIIFSEHYVATDLHSLVYNNIWFIKDIDITLMSIFI